MVLQGLIGVFLEKGHEWNQYSESIKIRVILVFIPEKGGGTSVDSKLHKENMLISDITLPFYNTTLKIRVA
jgi:hypothetical protein